MYSHKPICENTKLRKTFLWSVKPKTQNKNMLLDESYQGSVSKAKMLTAKWREVLDHEDAGSRRIEDPYLRYCTAQILENQADWFKKKGMLRSGGGRGVQRLNEAGLGNNDIYTSYGNPGYNVGQHGGDVPANNDFYAPGDARIPTTLIPMLRRTFPSLITHEIAGVQPMDGPLALIWALRYRYDGENLACFSPDGGCSMNAPAVSSAPWRAHSYQEAGNPAYLNTAHTGVINNSLSGIGVHNGAQSGSHFDSLPFEMGVAEQLLNWESKTNFPQMKFTLEKTAVEAGTRRLATKWPLEAEQDLGAMNRLDIRQEMTNIMAYELQAEIDREIVIRMRNIALQAGQGIANGYSLWSPCSADGRHFAERGVDLYARIVQIANIMTVKTRRGPANFLIVTPTVATILQTLDNYTLYNINHTLPQTQSFGITKIGTLGGEFTVYRDVHTEAQWVQGQRPNRIDYILLGYKGREFWDTGLVYAPYIPITIQETIGPNDGAARILMMTRYAVAESIWGSSNFYHVLILKGLGQACGANGPVYMG